MDRFIIPQIAAESKPTTDQADTLVITADKAVLLQQPHGIKLEVHYADIGYILEQIGFERIFDYWSLEMVQREVERYAAMQSDSQVPRLRA
jgi:hypothetical protein